MLGSAATFGFDSFPFSCSDKKISSLTGRRGNSFFMSIGTAIRTESQSPIAMEAFVKARAGPIALMARRRAEDGRRAA